MTVKEKIRKMIISKTIILVVIAAILACLCYYSSNRPQIPNFNNEHLIYTLVTVGCSIAILLFIAKRIGYFRLIFGKEVIGTVIDVRNENMRSRGKYGVFLEQNITRLVVLPDDNKKKISFLLPSQKIGMKIYYPGDRIHLIKSTRYPINLTREIEQHICPICGHNGFEDECPNCKIKF